MEEVSTEHKSDILPVISQQLLKQLMKVGVISEWYSSWAAYLHHMSVLGIQLLVFLFFLDFHFLSFFHLISTKFMNVQKYTQISTTLVGCSRLTIVLCFVC